MLNNVTITRQVGAGFGLISLMLVLLAVVTWSRLDSLRTVQDDMMHASDLAVTAGAISEGVAQTRLSIDQFTRSAARAEADQIMAQMQALQGQAEGMRQAGADGADQLLALLVRQTQDLNALTSAAIRHAAQIAQIRSMDSLQDRSGDRIDQLAGLIADPQAQLTALRTATSLRQLRLLMEQALTRPGPDSFQAAEAAVRDLQTQLAGLDGATPSDEARALLGTVRATIAGDWQMMDAVRTAQPGLDAAAAQIAATTAEIVSATDGILDAALATKERLDRQATEISSSAVVMILAGVALALLIGTAIAVLLSRRLGQGLARTVHQTQQLADGDLDTSITGTDERHELGDMARALTVLRENLRERAQLAAEAGHQTETIAAAREAEMKEQARVVRDIGDGLKRLAEGDLTTQIASPASDPFPASYESLREAFNSVLATLSGTVSRIADVADLVRGGSDEITSAAHDLSSRAETQAATLEQSAAALNEMSESVRSTAERARQAEHASQQNREIAETSSAIVRDAVDAMKGIEKSSDQITRIIGVIDDIAFQTNLLALNAGVEAARAGDAGRGFAVVASEVRGLAQRASASAREIKELISDSATQVKAGSSLVGRTGESLDLILGRAREVSELISAIARAAGEQAIGLSEINAGVNQLDQVTQQNAAVAEEANAAAMSLQQRSEDLLQEISGFRVNAAPRAQVTRLSARQGGHERAAPVPLRVVAGRGEAAAQLYEF